MLKYLIVSSMFMFTCAQAQVNSNRVSVSPQMPVPGKPVQLVYHAATGGLNNGKPIRVALYQFAGYDWHTDTASMALQGTDATASFNLLPDASFAAIKFYQGSLRSPYLADHNQDQGYTLRLTNKKGKLLPGGYLAQALLKLPPYKGGIPGYFETNVARMSADSLNLLLAQELQQKGTKPQNFVQHYLDLQRAIKGAQFKTEAPAILSELLASPNLTEQDLSAIQRLYQFELKDAAQAAKLKSDIISKFPKGSFARMEAYQQAVKESGSNEKMIAASEDFLKKFPISEWRKQPNGQDFIYYSLYRNLATAYFDSGNYAALLRLRKDWDFKTEAEVYRWNIVRAYISKSAPVAKFQPLADSLYKDLQVKINDQSYKVDFDTPEQMQANAELQLKNRTGDQINIHYANGDYDGALVFFQQMQPAVRYANADLNVIHIDLLDKTNRKGTVKEVLENSVKANAGTPQMFARLKQIYISQHGNDNGYEQYVASLKSVDETTAIQAYVKEHLMNHEMDPFVMEDMNGQMVRSSDWGGKIVVLDFWATWCRPCIEAFPGMQMLVDKYAKDSKVDFYFVGTMQFGDYRQKVKDFMARERWRFKVLHDGVNPQTREQNQVFSGLAKLFKSSGIPRKIILKDGVIRYSTEGYSGSPSKLADELTYAIETLKAEK